MARTIGFGATFALAIILLSGCGSGPDLGATAAPLKPGKLVALPDGRQLNLRCSGGGEPTVILESGFGADSGAWFKVQPRLAQVTRVCSYDRAGAGFSDLGPLPRDGANIARDLDAALRAAGEKGRFIVVGHSAGGLYARLFAARRPRDVAGLILLDPTVERRAPAPSRDGLDGIRSGLRRCLSAAEATPQAPAGDAVWSGCIPGGADAKTVARARLPDLWRGRLSELDNIFGRTSDHVLRIGDVLASTPLYVITASETAASAPSYNNQSILEFQHQMVAGASHAGSQRTVLSSHLMMIARPDVVVDATLEMVAAAREGRAPAALPPSEALALPDAGELARLLAPWNPLESIEGEPSAATR